MRETTRLLTAAALGAAAALCLAAGAPPDSAAGCARSADITKLNKRVDEVQQTLAALQGQSTSVAFGLCLGARKPH